MLILLENCQFNGLESDSQINFKPQELWGAKSEIFFKSNFRFLSVFFLTHSSAYPAELLGQWLLDDDNDKKVEDSSGGKNNGEVIEKAQWVDGKLGKALELDVKVLE